MKKNSNNAQTLKLSDDCYKFSKSVSYETFVGGTSTIGRGIKQTRRLFLSSADEALSAVGTLTSLLCNSAKVMEKLLRHVIMRRTSVRRGYFPEQGTHANEETLFASTWLMRLPRRIQRMLLVMTIPVLALILPLITTTESSAETWDCGEIANTVSCSLDENGVFTISGTGKMKDYQRASDKGLWYDNRPWGSIEIANREFTNIQTVVVGKGVTYIGSNAFEGFSCIKELKGMEDVEVIGGDAFYGTDLDDVNIPKAKTVGDYAFAGNSRLKNINMPNMEVFYGYSFAATPIRGYSGDCLQYKKGNCVRNDKWRCLSDYLLKENICIDSADGCGEGYKDMGGFCNRI